MATPTSLVPAADVTAGMTIHRHGDMTNCSHYGETVKSVRTYQNDGHTLVGIGGRDWPRWEWTLAPDELVRVAFDVDPSAGPVTYVPTEHLRQGMDTEAGDALLAVTPLPRSRVAVRYSLGWVARMPLGSRWLFHLLNHRQVYRSGHGEYIQTDSIQPAPSPPSGAFSTTP